MTKRLVAVGLAVVIALGITQRVPHPSTGRKPVVGHAGEDLPVSLTYEGRPLSGALVVAMNRLNPAAKLMARTDNNGRVAFRLPESGMWLIKAVHMIPAAAGTNADWASFWASLTFELKRSATGAAAK